MKQKQYGCNKYRYNMTWQWNFLYHDIQQKCLIDTLQTSINMQITFSSFEINYEFKNLNIKNTSRPNSVKSKAQRTHLSKLFNKKIAICLLSLALLVYVIYLGWYFAFNYHSL